MGYRNSIVWHGLVGGALLLAPAGPTAPSRAGEATVAAPELTEDLRFLALEEIDRQERLRTLRKKILLGEDARQQRLRQINRIYEQFAAAQNAPAGDHDALTLSYMKIRRHLAEALAGISEDRAMQEEILTFVRDALTDTKAPADVIRYLRGAYTAAVKRNEELDREDKRLRALARSIAFRMSRIPPPPEFISENGLRMVLVGAGPQAFYISAEPIGGDLYDRFREARASATGRPARPTADAGPTWHDAMLFCRWLSETERRLYRLPDVPQLEILSQFPSPVKGPIWSGSARRETNTEERRMSERFGVFMVHLWDPEGALGPKGISSELPFAVYPGLGFHAVTAQESGRQERWNRLRAKLE